MGTFLARSGSFNNLKVTNLASSSKANIVAIDSASGQLFYMSTASFGGGGSGTPGGLNKQIQFNSASVFSGSSNFTFDYNIGNLIYNAPDNPFYSSPEPINDPNNSSGSVLIGVGLTGSYIEPGLESLPLASIILGSYNSYQKLDSIYYLWNSFVVGNGSCGGLTRENAIEVGREVYNSIPFIKLPQLSSGNPGYNVTIDPTTKQLYYTQNVSVPGGNPNQIQFNSASAFAGATGFNFITGSSNELQLTGSFTVSSSLNVIGTSRVTGSLTVSSSLKVIGTSLITGSLVLSGSANITGSINTTGSINLIGTSSITGTSLVTGSLNISGSEYILGSGSAIFKIDGSVGPLLTVNDSNSGSLFSVNDISGLPIVDVRSDGSTLMGSSTAPSLNTTKKVVSTGAQAFALGGTLISTASYDGAFFEYMAKSGSNARSGYITSTWSGSTIVSSSITSSNIGNTSGLTTFAAISGSYIVLSGSANAASWTVKSIIRAI